MSIQDFSPDRRALLGLLPAALLASRGFAQSPGFHPAPLPKGQTRTLKLAVGGIADVPHLAVWYAKYNGYFDELKADGINVDVVAFGGGSEWLLALTSGQVNMAHGYYENGVRARSQGRDVILIDNILPTPGFLILLRKGLADKVKTVADARGLTWGITSLGSATHAVSLRVIKSFGLDAKDVRFISVGGNTGYIPSIREARVDILTASFNAANLLLKEGSATLLLDMDSAAAVEKIYHHPYMGPGLLTSHAYVEQEPYVTLRVVGAIRKSIAALKKAKPADVARVLPAEFQTPTLEDGIADTVAAFTADGIVSLEAATAMIADMSDIKLGKGGIDPSDTFDNRFVQAVKQGA